MNYYNEIEPKAAAWIRELIIPQVAARFIRAYMDLRGIGSVSESVGTTPDPLILDFP